MMKKEITQSPFFALRTNGNNEMMDTNGYWSYPAFVRNNKGGQTEVYWLYLILPIVPMFEKKKTALFRPKAMLITKPNSNIVLRYENYQLGFDPFSNEAWDTPIAMYPYQSIEHMSKLDLNKAEKVLIESAKRETVSFGKTGSLSKEFIVQWIRLIHPIFLPYLEQLAPEFIQMLGIKKAK